MRAFQVTLPHFYQIDSQDQAAVIGQLVSLFAGPLQHCRFLTFIMPASLERLERERRRLAMSISDDWARRGLMEEVRMIGDWASRGEMRKTRHYLIDFNDAITTTDLAHWRILSEEGYPQLPIPGDYAEHHDHMAPVLRKKNGGLQLDNSRYRYAALGSYQLTRTWDWRHPLAQTITAADGPMVICIDVRKLHPERVTASAEFWQGMILNGQDRNALIASEEAEAALQARDEAVHHVRILFMLLDKNVTALRARLDGLRKTSAQYMKVDRLLGYQAAAARMFGPVARPSGMPAGHFNTLSRAPAVFAGMWGVGREQSHRGFYVGVSVDEVAPHVYYLDWRDNDPFHGIILGRTGKGKTVAAQALAWRMAEQDVQVVLLEPQGHSRRLLQLAGGRNVSYSQLSYATTQLNILDVVYDNPTDQYDHVLTLLGLLLDPLGNNPRRFNNAEVAAVRRALQLTYARYDWRGELMANHALTPTLATLCHKLYQTAESGATLLAVNGEGAGGPASGRRVALAAGGLAEEIESLYVHGDYAGNFNAPTNLDLTLKERIVLFDFSQVPERRRPLFYYATLAGINHQVRRRPRKRAIFVDEVHYMSQEPSLMTFLANMVKTVRTFRTGVIMIDQDLEAFIGVEGAQAESMAAGTNVTAGQFILNNTPLTVSLGLKRSAAFRLADHYKDEILRSQAEFLARVGSDDRYGKGMAVIRANGRADMVYFQLRPLEAEYLLGS
jgi:Cdc6-like AAA superfamily ATPase